MNSFDENTCAWTRERIDPYIDGDLEAEELHRFEQHLEICPECQRELALARQIVGDLRSLPRQSCPDGVVERAAAGISRPEPESPRWNLRDWLNRGRVFAMRPSMAAMVFIVVVAAAYIAYDHDLLRHGGGSDIDTLVTPYTPEEIIAAKQDLELAFAYVSKYSRKAGFIVRNDVIDQRVLPTVREAMERKATSKQP